MSNCHDNQSTFYSVIKNSHKKSKMVNLLKNLFFLCLILLSILQSNASQKRHAGSNKKSNLAVLLAYKPNSEIQTTDEKNNSYTYKISKDSSNDNASEELNRKLMEIFVKQKFSSLGEESQQKSKRENQNKFAEASCESHESIDEAKIVELQQKEDKRSCYRNTYKNVLNAFEDALKSQIKSYQKCVCKKKQESTTTTTTSTTTTTEPPPSEESAEIAIQSRNMDNEDELGAAIDHPSDVICFHKQYAFMLNKLLDTIPCNKKKTEESFPADINDYHGEEKNRNERQSSRFNEIQDGDNEDELRQQIKAIMKEYLSMKNKNKEKATTTTTTTTTTPEPSVEDITDEEKFFDKLRNLFQQLESNDETFPVSRDRASNTKSTTGMSPSKSPKKSNIGETLRKKLHNAEASSENRPRKSRRIQNESPRFPTTTRRVVTEHSDESTETSIVLSKGKSEKRSRESKENLRENNTKHSSSKHANSPSYRTSSRTDFSSLSHSQRFSPGTDSNSSAQARHTSSRTDSEITSNTLPHSHRTNANSSRNNNSKKNKEEKNSTESREGGYVDDDRLASHLAQTISNFAKKYFKNQ